MDTTSDTAALTGLSERFIEGFHRGSWELLEPILSPNFADACFWPLES